MYLCNFELKGVKENIKYIVESIEGGKHPCAENIQVNKVLQENDCLVAEIGACCVDDYTELIASLAEVRVMAFLEDWDNDNVCLGISDIGSDEFDEIIELFDYDFHGDDRCAFLYYPSESFEDTFLWEGAGEYGKIEYECPVMDWWKNNDLKPKVSDKKKSDSEELYLYTKYDNDIIIDKYKGKEEDVIIPEEINGIPVTAINSNAFKNCRKIKSITIPKNR